MTAISIPGLSIVSTTRQHLQITRPRYWRNYPSSPTPQQFSLKQRIVGPMSSHTNISLGLIGRLCYGWLYTDDLYYVRVDEELKENGF
jgi:hypothetical protein